MRAVLSFLFLMFAGIGLFAQVSQTGYYITKDGKRYNGVTIENPDYADACERVMIWQVLLPKGHCSLWDRLWL